MKRFKRLQALLFSLVFVLTTIAPSLTIASAANGEEDTVTSVLLDLQFESEEDLRSILGQDQASDENTLTVDTSWKVLRYYQDGSDYMLRFPLAKKIDLESEATYVIEMRVQNPVENYRLLGLSDGNPMVLDSDRGDIYAQFADIGLLALCRNSYTYGNETDWQYAEVDLSLSQNTSGIGSARHDEWRTIKLTYSNKMIYLEVTDEKKSGTKSTYTTELPLSRISGDREFYHKAGRTYDHVLLWNEPQFRSMYLDYIKVTEIAPVVDPDAPVKIVDYDFDIAKPQVENYTGTMQRGTNYIDRWNQEITSGRMEDINDGRDYEGKLFLEPLGEPNATMYLGYPLPTRLFKGNKQIVNVSFDFELAIGQDRGTGIGDTYLFLGDGDDARTPYEDTNMKDLGLFNNGGFVEEGVYSSFYPQILDHVFIDDEYVISLNETHHIDLSMNTQDNTYTATISTSEFGDPFSATYTGTLPNGDFGWKDDAILDKFKVVGNEDIVIDNLLITVKYLEPPTYVDEDEDVFQGEFTLGEEVEIYNEKFNRDLPAEYVLVGNTQVGPEIVNRRLNIGSTTGAAMIVPIGETIKFDGQNEYTISYRYDNDSLNMRGLVLAANNTDTFPYMVYGHGFTTLKVNSYTPYPDFPNYKQWLGIQGFTFDNYILNGQDVDYTLKINTLTYDVTATLVDVDTETLIEEKTWNIRNQKGEESFDKGEEYPYIAYYALDGRNFPAFYKNVTITKRPITIVSQGPEEEDPNAPKYTYTFYDEDGETVLKRRTVAEGTRIVPPTAVKDSTAQYSYVFAGWTGGYTEGMQITQDISFTATYTQTVNKYVYTFVDGENEVKTATVDYGTVIEAPATNPSKAETAQYKYTFTGWNGFTEGMTITKDETFTANYDVETKQYTYTFLDDDRETVLATGRIDYGTVIPKPLNPTKQPSAQNTYQFRGWTGYTNGQTITEDVTFIAQYRAIPIENDPQGPTPGEETVLLDLQFNSAEDASKYSFKSAVDGVSDRADGDTSSALIRDGFLDIYHDIGQYMVYIPLSEAMNIDGGDVYTVKARLQMPVTANRVMGLVNSSNIGTNTNDTVWGRFAESFLAIYAGKVDNNNGTFSLCGEGTGLPFGGNDIWSDVEIKYGNGKVIMTVSYEDNGQTVTNTDTLELSALSTGGTFKHTTGTTYDNIVFGMYGDDAPARWGRIKLDSIKVTKVAGQGGVVSPSEEINLPYNEGTYLAKLEFRDEADTNLFTYRNCTGVATPNVSAQAYYSMGNGELTYFRGSDDNFIQIPLSEAINLEGEDTYQIQMRAKLPKETYRFMALVNLENDATYTTSTWEKLTKNYLTLFNNGEGFTLVNGTEAIPHGGESVWTDIVITYKDGEIKLEALYEDNGQYVVNTQTAQLSDVTGTTEHTHRAGTVYDALMIATIGASTYKVMYFDYIAVIKNPVDDVITIPEYTYTFYDEDGTTVLKQLTVEEGTEIIPPIDPYKAGDSEYIYTFAGWEGFTPGMTISGNVSFTAQYTQEENTGDPNIPTVTPRYTYTFYDEDGTTILKVETVEEGTVITPPQNPAKNSTAQYTYTFEGWDNGYADGMTISANISFKAIYTETVNQYVYKFIDGDNEIKVETVDYGTVIEAPAENPTKEADEQYTYTFERWEGFTEGMTISSNVTFRAIYTQTPVTNPDGPGGDEPGGDQPGGDQPGGDQPDGSYEGMEEYEDMQLMKTFEFNDDTDVIITSPAYSMVNSRASQLEMSSDFNEKPVYLKLDEAIDLLSEDYSYVLEFKVKTPTGSQNSRMIGLSNGAEDVSLYEAMINNFILANNIAGNSDNEKRIQLAQKSKAIGNSSNNEWKVIRYTLSKYSYRMEVVVYNADGTIKLQEEARGSLESVSGAAGKGFHTIGKTYDHIVFGHIGDSTGEKLIVDYVKVSKMPLIDQAPEVDDEVVRPLEPVDPQNPGTLLDVNFDDKEGNFVEFSGTVNTKIQTLDDNSKYMKINFNTKGDSFGGWYFTDTMPNGDKSDYVVTFDFMLHRGRHDNYSQFAESFVAINDSMNCDGEQTYHQFRLLGAKNYGSVGKFVVGTHEISGENSDIVPDAWYSYYMKFNRGTGAFDVVIKQKGTDNELKLSANSVDSNWGGMISSKEYDSFKYYRNGSISLDNIKIEKVPNIPVLSRNGVSFIKDRVEMEDPASNVNILVDTIALDFAEKMDMSTFADGNIKLMANGQEIEFTYEAKQSQVLLTGFMLLPNTEYTIFVSENVKSAFGSNIANDFEFKFTTGDPRFEAKLEAIKLKTATVKAFGEFSPGKSYDAIIDFANITNSDKNAQVIMVYRDINGKVLRKEAQAITMNAMTMETQKVTFKYTRTVGCTNVEFMLWESLDSVKALSESLNFTKRQ